MSAAGGAADMLWVFSGHGWQHMQLLHVLCYLLAVCMLCSLHAWAVCTPVDTHLLPQKGSPSKLQGHCSVCLCITRDCLQRGASCSWRCTCVRVCQSASACMQRTPPSVLRAQKRLAPADATCRHSLSGSANHPCTKSDKSASGRTGLSYRLHTCA